MLLWVGTAARVSKGWIENQTRSGQVRSGQVRSHDLDGHDLDGLDLYGLHPLWIQDVADLNSSLPKQVGLAGHDLHKVVSRPTRSIDQVAPYPRTSWSRRSRTSRSTRSTRSRTSGSTPSCINIRGPGVGAYVL